jgi:DNA-binding CsgD family transcriptional regulator/tetratricopeptide (TPR) repeat protein
MVGGPRRVDRVSPVLVGRSEALELAVRRWNETLTGPGHTLLVTGEAGIGKTRLLAELPARLSGAVTVVDAATFPRDGQAAGAVMLALADGFRRAGLAKTGGLLRARLLESDGTGDTARRRRLLVGDLAELVVVSVTERPTLVRIEDLHWADDLSLDVLDRVALGLRTGRSMVVATFRSDELAPSTALGRWRARLLSQRLAEEVRLPRLDLANTGAIVEAVTGAVPSNEFLIALHVRSDGIPLHIEELLAGGSLDDVPDTVAESVVVRAETLDPVTRAVLDAGAVIGRSFDPDLLGTVAAQPADVIDSALGNLIVGHLVVPLGDLFVFRHALICDAVYAVIPPNRKRRLHAAVAEAAARAGLSDSYVSDHYERSRDHANAYFHALAGARYATRVSAHREAAELLRRAQRTAPEELEAAARASLDAELAIELAAIDDNEGAAANLEAAIELFRGVGDEEAAAALVPRLMAAHHLLGLGLAGRARLAHDALDRLDRIDGGGSALVRAGLHGALAAAHMLDRSLDEALDYGRRAAAVFGDTAARADVDLTVGSVLVFAGRLDDGWALLESTIATSAGAGLEAETARGYRMLATSASVVVEYDRAERWLTEGLAYTLRTERGNDQYYIAAHLAHVHWARGRWKDAHALAREALANGRGITTRITALVVLGYLDLGRGRFESARAVLHSALQLAEPMAELQRISPVLWGLAEAALQEGDPALAVDLVERGYAQSARVADAAYLFPFVVTGTRAYLAQHQSHRARNWVQRCSDLLRMRDLPGTLPALAHAEGLIELAEGQTGVARTLLENAFARWEGCGRTWEAGLALVDLAHCAVRSRRPADAARFVDVARGRAESGDLLETLATAVNIGEAAVGPLSRREEEVAALVASGLTNREIASRLVISPKTASTHVEHILTKLGASRRAEIAVWVTRREV